MVLRGGKRALRDDKKVLKGVRKKTKQKLQLITSLSLSLSLSLTFSKTSTPFHWVAFFPSVSTGISTDLVSAVVL